MDWFLPILVGVVIVGLVGVIWRTHELHDRERIEAIWDQLGRSSKQGMREIVHEDNRKISEALAGQESMKEDIDRLMRKVFNGHGAER